MKPPLDLSRENIECVAAALENGDGSIVVHGPRRATLEEHAADMLRHLAQLHDMHAVTVDMLAGSVLQGWAMRLPLCEQGVLLTAVRDCDLAPKPPMDSPERRLTGALRYAFMRPADPREVDYESRCFFLSRVPVDIKVSALGHYPMHWLTHVMHAAEVVGYRHPVADTRNQWLEVYHRFCGALHVGPESYVDMVDRLSRDRIAAGEVVSWVMEAE